MKHHLTNNNTRGTRVVGKLQWLAHTRPDIAYSIKELARDLTAPTELSNKRVKHLIRYLQGTKHYKFIIQPTTTLNSDTNNCLDLEIYVDADWAGCPTTRKSRINIRLQHQTTQHNNRIWKQDSSYSCFELSRIRALRNLHRSE